MISFEPIQLKDEVLIALEQFSFTEGEIDCIDFDQLLDEDCYDEYDAIITENSEVCLCIGEGEYPRTTLKYLLKVSRGWKDTKLNEKQNYAKSKNEVEFLLNVNDYNTIMFLDGLKESTNSIVQDTLEGTEFWHSQITVNQKNYHISLFNGLCIYHLLVQESGNYDEYLPAYSEYDYFVRITSEDEVDIGIADSLAVSFVFELHARHNLVISFSEGRTDPEAPYYDESELSRQNLEIFPLLYGRGIKELLELYNTAKTTYDIDYKILGFTKVIEYISPTIAKEELYECVRLKLTSPVVFTPTSEFVNELGEIYKKHQNDVSKDSELIRLAVSTVIELSSVWNDLPAYIKPKNSECIESLDDSLKESCTENLITAIYDTRNEIAHAKANYEKKGKECPDKNKEQFSKILDIIAVRCIRWFAMQSDEKRVVLS